MDTVDKMKAVAKEICEREGCKLYDIDFTSGSKGRGRKLVIYVEKQGGVNLEDCEKVSKGVGEMLDSEDLIPGGEYALEVSSPGLDRPLKERWHFEAVIGQKIYVQSAESLIPDNPENFKRFKVTGMLEKMNGDTLFLKAEGQDFLIPFQNVKKSNVVFEFDSSKKLESNKKKN